MIIDLNIKVCGFLSGRKLEKGTIRRGTVYVDLKILRKWLQQVRI